MSKQHETLGDLVAKELSPEVQAKRQKKLNQDLRSKVLEKVRRMNRGT